MMTPLLVVQQMAGQSTFSAALLQITLLKTIRPPANPALSPLYSLVLSYDISVDFSGPRIGYSHESNELNPDIEEVQENRGLLHDRIKDEYCSCCRLANSGRCLGVVVLEWLPGLHINGIGENPECHYLPAYSYTYSYTKLYTTRL